ncbi:hypothetical protein [Streptomyces sp. NPDC002520]
MHRSLEHLAAAGSVAGPIVIVVCGLLVTAALLGAVLRSPYLSGARLRETRRGEVDLRKLGTKE